MSSKTELPDPKVKIVPRPNYRMPHGLGVHGPMCAWWDILARYRGVTKGMQVLVVNTLTMLEFSQKHNFDLCSLDSFESNRNPNRIGNEIGSLLVGNIYFRFNRSDFY